MLPAQSEAVDHRGDSCLAAAQDRFRKAGRWAKSRTSSTGMQPFGLSSRTRTCAALRVSGVFNAYDSNSFVAFLESLDGRPGRAYAGEIRVLREDVRQPGEGQPTN
jgi:hypothetical protein